MLFARKNAQTISFIERGFERLGLGHRTVVFVVFTLGVFLLEADWEALVFGLFSQPLFGALIFTLYSPSWLILALHLLVRQVLTSIPVPSAVPSYFLLVAMIEVTPSKRLFSLT